MRPRLLTAASWLAVMAAACGGGEETLWLSFPPEADTARSMLLAIELEGGIRVFAYALAPPPARIDLPLVLPPDAPTTLTALLYDAPLAEMGLATGELTPVPAGERTRVLPDARSMFAASLPETTWRATTTRSTALAGFRIAAAPASATPCATFDARTIALPSVTGANFAVPLTPSKVLVGVDSGQAFAITATSVTQLRTPRGAPGYFPIESGLRTSDGWLWLGGERGELYRARPDEEGRFDAIEHVATSSSGQGFRWMDGGPLPGGATEIFVLAKKGAVERWDGVRFTKLYQLEDIEMGLGKGGVAWLAPGRAVIVSGTIASAIRYDAGRVTREEVSVGAEAFTAVAQLPSSALVIGSDHGRLYLQESTGGAWRALEGSMLALHLNMLTAFERGFLYGGVNGFFGQWDPDHGFCAIRQLGAQTLRFIAPLGGGYLVAGDHGPGRDLPVVILDRR